MKVIGIMLSVASIAMASAAQAQSVRNYRCSLDGSNDEIRLRFGPGEVRYELAKGGWSENLCNFQDSICEFQGSRFVGENEGFDLNYDSATGRYSFGEMMMENDDRGVCRPE